MMKKIGQIYGKMMKKHEKMESKGKEMKEEKKKLSSYKANKLQKHL